MKIPIPGHLSDRFTGGASFGVPASKLSFRRCVLSEQHLLHTIEHLPVDLIAPKTSSKNPPRLTHRTNVK